MSGNSRKKDGSTCMHKERSRQFAGNQPDLRAGQSMRQVVQDRGDEAASGMTCIETFTVCVSDRPLVRQQSTREHI
jgi:hypothetical protein